MKEIYTIGYSCFNIEDFIEILKINKISCLVDVRSNPYSKFHVDYNKNNLQNILKNNGIIYRNYKVEFGARQEDLQYYTDGYLDFFKYTKSKSFMKGVKKIEAGMKMNYTFVFMCAEKDPITCHRNIMVARKFHTLGYLVKNIISDGSYELQEDIEKRLVEEYFPDRNQISLFSESLSWNDMVEKSYKYRNSEIGYRIDNIDKVNLL